MAFTPLENIALILIVVSVIKILVILINPGSWFNFAKKVWSNSGITRMIALILAIIVFYYLMQELTIVQILAVTAFVALTIAVGLGDRINELLKHYEKLMKNRKMLKDHWMYLVIWLALMIWGIKELFNL